MSRLKAKPRHLLPACRRISRERPALPLADGWMPGTSPGMTVEAVACAAATFVPVCVRSERGWLRATDHSWCHARTCSEHPGPRELHVPISVASGSRDAAGCEAGGVRCSHQSSAGSSGPVPSIDHSACSGVCGGMGPRDKPEDDARDSAHGAAGTEALRRPGRMRRFRV